MINLIAPMILIGAYMGFLIYLRGALPASEEIIAHFASIYARYGYEIIFVSAILEALVLVNLFVPGLIAMAMGAVFARTGHIELTLVVLFATSGLILGYLIDFALGYFGFGDILLKVNLSWILKKARRQLEKFGYHGLILGFAYPNVAAFLSLAAGTTKMNFGHFVILATTSSAFWMPIWGLIIYSLGEIFLTILTRYSFLVILIVLSSIFLIRVGRQEIGRHVRS